MTRPSSSDGLRRVHHHLARLVNEELEQAPSPGEVNIAGLADKLLEDAVREHASDIHLEPESRSSRLRFRIDGTLLDTAELTTPQAKRLVRHFMTMAGLDPVTIFKPEESRRTIQVNGYELDSRLVFAPCVMGEKMNIRLLDSSRVETRIDALGLNQVHRESMRRWLENLNGMFLVTGPTGSGKTTTLYALLHELKQLDRNIVTIEDPVEFQIDGITQMQVNERRDLTFAAGIKAMLRLDPDFLMVGEIRDKESARAAADAAVSGRVLLSTLHSRDAVGAITALRSWGLNDHEISASLTVAVAQRLVRRLCPKCCRAEAPTAAEIAWLELLDQPVPQATWHAPGCDDCEGLGYRGRTGVFEFWLLDEEDYDLILHHADERAMRLVLARKNYLPLMVDGLAKARAGITSIDELRKTIAADQRFPLTQLPTEVPLHADDRR